MNRRNFLKLTIATATAAALPQINFAKAHATAILSQITWSLDYYAGHAAWFMMGKWASGTENCYIAEWLDEPSDGFTEDMIDEIKNLLVPRLIDFANRNPCRIQI